MIGSSTGVATPLTAYRLPFLVCGAWEKWAMQVVVFHHRNTSVPILPVLARLHFLKELSRQKSQVRNEYRYLTCYLTTKPPV